MLTVSPIFDFQTKECVLKMNNSFSNAKLFFKGLKMVSKENKEGQQHRMVGAFVSSSINAETTASKNNTRTHRDAGTKNLGCEILMK